MFHLQTPQKNKTATNVSPSPFQVPSKSPSSPSPSRKSQVWWSLRSPEKPIWSFGETDKNPIGSMYGIFTNIWLIFMVNVGKYTIHGSSGNQKIRWFMVGTFGGKGNELPQIFNHMHYFFCWNFIMMSPSISGPLLQWQIMATSAPMMV